MVSRVVTNVGSVAKEPNNQKNAFYSILFECVPLVILLRNDDLMRDTAMVCRSHLLPVLGVHHARFASGVTKSSFPRGRIRAYSEQNAGFLDEKEVFFGGARRILN